MPLILRALEMARVRLRFQSSKLQYIDLGLLGFRDKDDILKWLLLDMDIKCR